MTLLQTWRCVGKGIGNWFAYIAIEVGVALVSLDIEANMPALRRNRIPFFRAWSCVAKRIVVAACMLLKLHLPLYDKRKDPECRDPDVGDENRSRPLGGTCPCSARLSSCQPENQFWDASRKVFKRV